MAVTTPAFAPAGTGTTPSLVPVCDAGANAPYFLSKGLVVVVGAFVVVVAGAFVVAVVEELEEVEPPDADFLLLLPQATARSDNTATTTNAPGLNALM
jgi:hypothetical protein